MPELRRELSEGLLGEGRKNDAPALVGPLELEVPLSVEVGSRDGHTPIAIENALDGLAKTQLVSPGNIPQAQNNRHD